MLKDKKILALITARAASKGLPGKNIKLLKGKPLIAWSIEQARASKYIDRIIVSTDSRQIAKISQGYGAEAPFLRPGYLATDTAASVDVILHTLDFLAKEDDIYNYVCLLEPTSPLREAKDIDICLETLIGNNCAESIVSICPLESQHPEFNVVLTADNFIKKYESSKEIKPLMRQELTPVYFFDGTIYISKVAAFKKKKTFYHDKTLGFVVPRYKGLEIDDIYDFVAAEALLNFRASGSANLQVAE